MKLPYAIGLVSVLYTVFVALALSVRPASAATDYTYRQTLALESMARSLKALERACQ